MSMIIGQWMPPRYSLVGQWVLPPELPQTQWPEPVDVAGVTVVVGPSGPQGPTGAGSDWQITDW